MSKAGCGFPQAVPARISLGLCFFLFAGAWSLSAGEEAYNKWSHKKISVTLDGKEFPVLVNRLTQKIEYIWLEGKYAPADAASGNTLRSIPKLNPPKKSAKLAGKEFTADAQQKIVVKGAFPKWGAPLISVFILFFSGAGIFLYFKYFFKNREMAFIDSAESRPWHRGAEKIKQMLWVAKVKPASREEIAASAGAGDATETVQTGVKILRFPNGRMQVREQYKNGKLHGIQRSYYESGILQAEVHYENGAIHGVWKKYHEEGQLIYVSAPYVNGEQSGMAIRFYPTGALQMESQYEKNKKEGAEREYYENGRLAIENHYHQGELHGPSRIYAFNGTLEKEIFYEWGALSEKKP